MRLVIKIAVAALLVFCISATSAAFAAGKAVGFFDQLTWTADQTWTPQMDETQRADLYRNWKKAVTRTFEWVD